MLCDETSCTDTSRAKPARSQHSGLLGRNRLRTLAEVFRAEETGTLVIFVMGGLSWPST